MSKHQFFGARLQQARKRKDLTAEEVAILCGVSRSYVTLLENGRRLPGKKLIPKIALALGLKVVVVLNWYLEDVSQKIRQNLKSN